MQKILLTGFEPFGGEDLNPSKELLASGLRGIDTTSVLPVSFKRAFMQLETILNTVAFTDIVMLGQAGGRAQVCVERVALNCMDSEIPDADGFAAKDQPIVADGPAAWFSPYPLRQWSDAARAQGLPLDVSNTAGTYVCNDLSYKVAQWSQGRALRWVFVHLPYLPVQIQGKPDSAPSLSLESMKTCVQFVLDKIRSMQS